MKKKLHGGKRSGSGRPSVNDKKITLTIYPRQSDVDRVGGIDKAKEIALKSLST